MGQTNQTVHMIKPSKDNFYNGRKGIGFENPSYFEKAKDLRPTLYDKKVIGQDLDTSSSIRRPKHSGVIWKKKGSSNISNVDLSAVSLSKLNKNVKRYSRKDLLSCNNSHLGETSSAYMCNDAMNVSCNPTMCDLLDDNNFFIFDVESIKISPVSKMPFRKMPYDSMNVHSKSNSNKSLPRTERCSKHMTGNRALLTNFVEKFLGMVRFGNTDFAMIAGYGDVVIRSMMTKKGYYVEGLGHNLFSVGQFCDKRLESNDAVKLQALIDRKKVIITEDTIRQAIRLDDADGIACLPNEEIFAELARIGYEKPTAWNKFSSSVASAVIYLATGGCIQMGGIAELDADEDVTLVDVDAEVEMDTNIQGRMTESQAKAYNLDLQHSKIVLSMQDTDEAELAEVEEVLKVVTATKLMTKVVTTPAPITTIAQVPKASAPRRRRGVVMQDPEEIATASVVVHSEV
nr:integrase, catalytic region, zinc finger, CCHC-type, peptidase aspartic, catalytic [Tanacetum cinerariifolium]